jgi:hypothetical protein
VLLSVLGELEGAGRARHRKELCYAYAAQCACVSNAYQLAYLGNPAAFHDAELSALYSKCSEQLVELLAAVRMPAHPQLVRATASGGAKSGCSRQACC